MTEAQENTETDIETDDEEVEPPDIIGADGTRYNFAERAARFCDTPETIDDTWSFTPPPDGYNPDEDSDTK